jgi:serine/threonine protein kinase
MGEVWRARDTKLNRDVAIKVLPEALTLDPERIARLTREAQVLASLNHQNIAAIHCFDLAGWQTVPLAVPHGSGAGVDRCAQLAGAASPAAIDVGSGLSRTEYPA